MKQYILILFSSILLISCNSIIVKVVTHRQNKYYGDTVSNFEAFDINDSVIDINSYKGKVIYLTIGDINCGGNKNFQKIELPKLMNLYREFDNLIFVNILMENDKNKWKDFISENQPLGTNLRYEGDRNQLLKLFHTDAIPLECVINKEFKIAGYDLCGFGSEAAPFYALHDGDFRKSLKEIMKISKYETTSLWYINEMIKNNLDANYAYSSFYFDFENKKQDISEFKDSSEIKILKGIKASDLLDTIVKKHEGKIIYIDFWGTWCSPCKTEMRYSGELKKELDTNTVKFVYICISSDYKQCVSYVNFNRINGEHYYLNKEESKNIMNMYGIQGIPYYMIIDKDGLIHYKGNEIRPSNSETKTKIIDLMKIRP